MSMELDHSFTVPLPPDRAWGVLLDVERIAPCIPGATYEVNGDVVTGHIKIKVGPVSLTYRGTATLTERDPDAHIVVVKASGTETRGAGTASATIRASLTPDSTGTGTLVTMHTTMNLTGRPAQFGRGVMVEVGGKLVEQFAANLTQQIARDAEVGEHHVAEMAAAPVPQDREREIVSREPAIEVNGLRAGITGTFPSGTRVAGYRLQKQLGHGGMAVVYLARDERLDRLVALKILTPTLATDEAFRRRFIRESRAVAALDDPHIIPVFEAGEAQGVLYIAMRYVPSGDVLTVIRRDGPLSPRRATALISQIASALDTAHAAGLVHRDIKPANMLVDVRPNRADHAYLSDFGLSKKALATSVGLTGKGQFLGTMDYVAPEQIQGKPTDGRTDQYGLACATFELLTGTPPFRREEALAVMYAHLSEPPPPVTARRADLPTAVDWVITRALAKAPADRYPSCQEFADALTQALDVRRHDFSSWTPEYPAPNHPPTEIDWRRDQPADQRDFHTPNAASSSIRPQHAEADIPTRDSSIPRVDSSGTGKPTLGPTTWPRPARRQMVAPRAPRSANRNGLALRYATRSDVGLLPEGNEDSAYAGPRLLAVADGTGGRTAGEVASSLTIASLAELDADPPPDDMLTALASAVANANSRLRSKIIANPAVEGMGTTLTALLWSDGHAAVCHIGNSRAYLLRQGELYRITHDHTLVQSLVDEGRISAEDLRIHPQRSLLSRALDGRSTAEPDLSVHDARPGDRYLLCTYGLWDVVSDETLRDSLEAVADPAATTRELIELAIAGGGPDNITCVVADVVDSAITRLPLPSAPVFAGAAANAAGLELGADRSEPFGTIERDRELRSRNDRPPAPPRFRWARDDFARAGRNDPCPCGSGRKFKRCHGDPRMRPDT